MANNLEETRKQKLLKELKEYPDAKGIVMAIRRPTGDIELIIDAFNLQAKALYIEMAYDEDLHLLAAPSIYVVRWMIV